MMTAVTDRTLIVAKDPDGNLVPVAADAAGVLQTTGGGGGGGGTLVIADGAGATQADVIASRLQVSDQHAQPLTDAELRTTPVNVATGLTQPLTDTQLRATPVPVTGTVSVTPDADVESVCTTASTLGDNIVLAVGAAQRLRLQWISCQADPNIEAVPEIRVLIGTTERYRGYGVIQHRQKFEGALGEDLVVNISVAMSVVVTAHYELFA